MTTPVLSIITVCFNANRGVSTTINNLLQQTWTDFEYWVIDGGSSDGTVGLLQQSVTLFSEKGIPFHFISEPDKGIYDAMNKGTHLSHGKWLLFLNAGDILAETDTLEKVFLKPSNAQIIYGDTICIYQRRQKLYPALPLDHLSYEMAFCHQSAFIRRELLMEQPYDISYKVCADHHFFLSMYLRGRDFDYRPFPIAIYEIAGFSDENKFLSHREKHRMQKELEIFHVTLHWLLREISFYLKQGVKSLFGQKLINLVRKKRLH